MRWYSMARGYEPPVAAPSRLDIGPWSCLYRATIYRHRCIVVRTSEGIETTKRTRRPLHRRSPGLIVLACGSPRLAAGPATAPGRSSTRRARRRLGKLVEDAHGIVHVNVHVDGPYAGPARDPHPLASAPARRRSPRPAATTTRWPAARTAQPDWRPRRRPAEPHRQRGRRRPPRRDTDRVTLTDGPTTLFDTTAGAVGSSFIIHANEDDQVTDATNGNSGGRIACGVIVAG